MEKQKALDKQRFEISWSVTITLYHLTQSIIEKKKAVIALRIMKRIREDNANRVQRAARKYLNRSLIMFNPGSKVQYEDNTLEGKVKLRLFEGLTAFACLTNKMKNKRAGHILFKFVQDVEPIFGFFAAYGEYVKGIVHFQRKWRHYSEINKARAQIFMKCWTKYCLGVLDDESRKKKKRYTEQIMKLRDKHVMKYAKEYVLNKNKGFIKAARLMADKTGSIDEILPGKVGQSPKNAFVTAEPKDPNKKKVEVVSSKKEEAKSNTESKRIRPSYQPTKEEMKDIFEKVMEETKFLVEGLAD